MGNRSARTGSERNSLRAVVATSRNGLALAVIDELVDRHTEKNSSSGIDRTMGFRISLDETFEIGSDTGEPVCGDYQIPYDFEG